MGNRNKMVLLERYRYDDYAKMILHGNGVNDSTEIIDICGLKPMTAVGNTKISTAQSKFGGSSILFDGTNSYISTPDSNDFTLGNENWTIDCWVYLNSNKNYNFICCQRLGANTNHNFSILINSSGNVSFAFLDGAEYKSAVYTTAVLSQEWTHLAIVRNGVYVRCYKNGVLSGTYELTSGFSFANVSYDFIIGASRSDETTYSNFFNGYIDEFRFSKGVARWTADFTPPTAQY